VLNNYRTHVTLKLLGNKIKNGAKGVLKKSTGALVGAIIAAKKNVPTPPTQPCGSYSEPGKQFQHPGDRFTTNPGDTTLDCYLYPEQKIDPFKEQEKANVHVQENQLKLNQQETLIILDETPIFVNEEVLNKLGSKDLLFTKRDESAISGRISYINQKAQRFLDINKNEGEHVSALYDMVTTFTELSQQTLSNGNTEGALVLAELSTRLLLFGQECTQGLKCY
jgi:hypothetical protein